MDELLYCCPAIDYFLSLSASSLRKLWKLTRSHPLSKGPIEGRIYASAGHLITTTLYPDKQNFSCGGYI